MWHSNLEVRGFRSEGELAAWVLGSLSQHASRYSVVAARWVKALVELEPPGIKKFVNRSSSFEWFQETVPEILSHEGRSLIVTNIPRVLPPEVAFRLVQKPSDTCSVYFINVHVPTYFEAVLNSIGVDAQRCMTCQVLSTPNDNGLLIDEQIRLRRMSDGEEARRLIIDGCDLLERVIRQKPDHMTRPQYAGAIVTWDRPRR